MKNVSILGSTGSIGTQSLDVIRQYKDEFKVVALACGTKVNEIAKQVIEFSPIYVSVGDEKCAKELKELLKGVDVTIGYGMEGLVTCATLEEADVVITAVVGMMGVLPTIEAIKAKKTIALANKETLVTAGHIIMPLAKEMGVSILPVDSEHSAIFQSLNGEEGNKIRRILLTASGGPFRGYTTKQLENVSLEDALHHPNWSMGRKITIDSSTLVNKGLEVMEARWLFGVDIDTVEVVVHPQSIIHSMVEYEDGAIIAELGTPDMRLPIEYALHYPKRKTLNTKFLDFKTLGSLTFEAPDTKTFRGLALAYEVGRKGGNLPTIYNAANELAVAYFLDKKIAYLDIIKIIEFALSKVSFIANPSLSEVLATEQEVYERIRKDGKF